MLKTTGRKLVALSNSSHALVEKQLTGAGLRSLFDEMLSVEMLGTYKPNLAVYQWALRSLRMPASQAMMVAAHGWDATRRHEHGFCGTSGTVFVSVGALTGPGRGKLVSAFRNFWDLTRGMAKKTRIAEAVMRKIKRTVAINYVFSPVVS
ncbi:HAD-IA family hydrolase [Salmonella enterica subsp. enterica serovar Colindale]|nr:HAD-IA family hydrolase [Salmonella enterica subsp. enterica serovar Colindale]